MDEHTEPDLNPNAAVPPPPPPAVPTTDPWADEGEIVSASDVGPFDGYGEPLVAEEPTGESVSTGLFVLLGVSLALVAAAIVYLFGAVDRADTEQTIAEEQGQAILDEDTGFTDLIEPDDSLPLVDDTNTSTTVAPATTVPEETDNPLHPGIQVVPSEIAVAFVNRAAGDDYGRVAYMTFEGERVQTDLRCTRLDLNLNRGICLNDGSGVITGPYGLVTDEFLAPVSQFPLNTPSRAAVSPEGTVVAWTGFTQGHSYLGEGEFATITQLISVDRRLGANLETIFTTYRDDEVLDAVDRNYWGVTFFDEDRFYATLGTGGTTSIVAGKISTSELQVLWDGVSCPEVSPDGSTVVAKEMRDDGFQLVAIDVLTGERRDLAETRLVDDQVEWLDNDTIMYALANDEVGTEAQPAFDIWVLDTVPGAEPQLLVPLADSPAAP